MRLTLKVMIFLVLLQSAFKDWVSSYMCSYFGCYVKPRRFFDMRKRQAEKPLASGTSVTDPCDAPIPVMHIRRLGRIDIFPDHDRKFRQLEKTSP